MRLAVCRRTGSAIFFVVIVLAVIGGGMYLLESMRSEREVEAQNFAREIVNRVAFQYDAAYLHSVIAEDRRVHFTPGREESFINAFQQLGQPAKDWRMTGHVDFENHYFAPEGHFTCILTYPDQRATVYLGVKSPNGTWKLDVLSVSWEHPGYQPSS